MLVIQKFQCEYCQKTYSSEGKCLKHESNHAKIKKFLDNNIDKEKLKNIKFDVREFLKTGKTTLDRDVIFGNGEYNPKEPLSKYKNLIKNYKKIQNIDVLNNSTIMPYDYNSIDIFSNQQYEIPFYLLFDPIHGKFTNFEFSRYSILIDLNISEYLNPEDMKKAVIMKLKSKNEITNVEIKDKKIHIYTRRDISGSDSNYHIEFDLFFG